MRRCLLFISLWGILLASLMTSVTYSRTTAVESSRHSSSATRSLSYAAMFGDGRDGPMPADGNIDSPNGVGIGAINGQVGSTTISVQGRHMVARINPDDYVLIHQTRGESAGVWELNKAVSDITGNGSFQLLNPLANTYKTSIYQDQNQAQIIRVPQFSSCNVTGTITPLQAWDGAIGGILALMCQDALTVSGAINADGYGFRGGDSGNSSYAADQWQGEGTLCSRTALVLQRRVESG